MAIDLREIMGAMGGEIGERFVHQKLADHLREEIAKGESSHDVVAKAIIRLRNNELLQAVRDLIGPRALGLGLTGLGAGIAKALQSVNVDGIHPDDQSPIMREVRFILKNLAPALIVGAADGTADTFEVDVKTAVAKLRSNDMVAKPQKAGALDKVYEIQSLDGVDYTKEYGLLFPEWDEEGNLQHDPLGAVILAGPNGKKFAEDWYKVHKGGEKEVPIDQPNDQNQNGRGGNRNQNGQQRFRKIQVPPEPYRGRLVPLAVAIMRLPVSVPMDPELTALAKAALTPKDPPASKEEKIDEGGSRFQRAWALTMALKSEHEQRKGRDLLSDLAAHPGRINTLGKQFSLADGVTTFTDDEIKSIYEYVQTWMGATLTVENKIRHAFARAKEILEGAAGTAAPFGNRLEDAIGTVAHVAGKIALGSAIGLTALFAMFLGLVIAGAFVVSLDSPLIGTSRDGMRFLPSLLFLALAWNFKGWIRYVLVVLGVTTGIPGVVFLTAHVMERLTPNEFAIALVAGGGFLACVELLLFTIIQGLLSLVMRFFPNLHKDWLVNKGRILIMFIAIHVGIFMILLSLKTPLILRLLICVPTFFALASQMGLSGYEFNEEARLRARKTLRLFSALTIIVFIAVIAILVVQLQGKSFSDVIGWITGSRILQSVLILIGAGYVVAKATRRMEETKRTTTNGMPTEILYRRNWWLRAVAIILVLGFVSWPWIGSDINAHFEEKKPTSSFTNWFTQAVTPAPQPAASQPIAQPPAPAVQASQNTPVHAKSVVSKRQKKTKLTAEECAGHSYEWQQELGCP